MSGGRSVNISGATITDWDSFFDVFDAAFGFPGFFGRNMNAWIDCMTSLDVREHELTTVHVAPGEIMTIVLHEASDFKKRCPDQYEALVECAAFVNYRRVEVGDAPVLGVAMIGYF